MTAYDSKRSMTVFETPKCFPDGPRPVQGDPILLHDGSRIAQRKRGPGAQDKWRREGAREEEHYIFLADARQSVAA